MNFTQPQITEILDEIAKGKDGYRRLLQYLILQNNSKMNPLKKQNIST